jgi:hypothetical protein
MTIVLSPDMPRRNMRSGGIVLSSPLPFAEGHVLSGNEAAALNQTYQENLGNNFRAKVNEFIKATIVGKDNPSKEELKGVSDDQVADLLDKYDADPSVIPVDKIQAAFDELIAGYQMGVRRTSSATAYSPEEKAARSIAKDKLKAALVKRGTKLNTVSGEWWEREIARLLDKDNPVLKGDRNVTEDIWKTADRQVKLLQQAAADGLDDLDMTGLTESNGNGNGSTEAGNRGNDSPDESQEATQSAEENVAAE